MTNTKLRCVDDSSSIIFVVDQVQGFASTLSTNFNNTTVSSNASTGSLVLKGGLSIQSTQNASSNTYGGALSIAGGMSILRDTYIGGTNYTSVLSSGNMYGINMTSNNAIISEYSGANIHLSNNLYVNGALVVTNISTVNLIDTNMTVSSLLVTGGSLNATSNANTLGNLFTTNGNIGISNTAPSNTLDVNGTARFSTSVTTGGLYAPLSTITNQVHTNVSTGVLIASTGISAGSISSASIYTSLSTITNQVHTNVSTATLIATTGISSGSITTASIYASFGTTTNWVTTNTSITNMNASSITTGTLFVPTGFLTNNATTVNLNATNSTLTNMIITNSSISTLNLSGMTTGTLNATNSITIGSSGLNVLGGVTISGVTTMTNTLNANFNSNTIANIITTGGNVGIGTVSPGTTLDVNGTARIGTSITTGALFATNSTMINVVATNMSTTNMTLNSQTVGTLFTTSLISSSNVASNNMTVSSMYINTLTSSANITANTITSSSLLVTGGSVRVLSSSGTSHTIGTLRIDSNGVGILKNPGVAFDVQGIIRAESLLITNSGLQATGSNGHTLGTLFVTSTGNVGIGKTAPSANFDVVGTAIISTSLTTGSVFAANSTITNSVFTSISSGILNISTGLTTGTLLATTSISTGQIYATNSTIINSVFTSITSTNMKMTSIDVLNATIGTLFTTNGNVGISTTSPGYKLDINGSVQAKGQVYFRNTQPSNNAADGALMVTGGLSVNSGVNSTSELNGGGLTVNGGAAVSGDLYIGGTLNCIGTASNSFAYITVTASDGAVNLTTGSIVTFGGLTIQSTINSSSTTNGGSFLTPGGASIGQDVYIGGSLYVNGYNNSPIVINQTIGSFVSTGVYQYTVTLPITMQNTAYKLIGSITSTTNQINTYMVSFTNLTTTSFIANIIRMDALFSSWNDANLTLSYVIYP